MLKAFVKFQALSAQKSEKGQSLAEYGLILALIAVVSIAALTLLGGEIEAAIDSVQAALKGALAG